VFISFESPAFQSVLTKASVFMILKINDLKVCKYWFKWVVNISGPSVCTKHVYGIRTIIGILPAWFRFAQCLRRYRDTKLVFPHIVNAGKYSTSFVTAIFSTLYHLQIGKYIRVKNA